MFLKEKSSDDLVEVVDLHELLDPQREHIAGRRQAGQEEQASKEYRKSVLVFPSGEPLPRCWVENGV